MKALVLWPELAAWVEGVADEAAARDLLASLNADAVYLSDDDGATLRRVDS